MFKVSGELGQKAYNAFSFFFFDSHVLCKVGIWFSVPSHFKI